MESLRPELVLLDWTRFEEGEGNNTHEIISFRKIRNAGRGAAFNVLIGDTQTVDFPTIHIRYFRIDVIAANETVDVDGKVIVWWKNKPQKEGDPYKHANIIIPISFADSSGVMYFTEFGTYAAFPATENTNGDLTTGLFWKSKKTIRKPVWRQKIEERKMKGRPARPVILGITFRQTEPHPESDPGNQPSMEVDSPSPFQPDDRRH